MELIKADFDVFRIKCKKIIFRTNRINQNIYETPRGYLRNVSIITPENTFNLLLEKVMFKPNQVVFRFRPNKIKLPTKIFNVSINIIKKPKEILKVTQNIPEKPKEIPNVTQNIPEKPKEIPKVTQNIPEKPKEIPKVTQNIPEKPKETPKETQNISVFPRTTQRYPRVSNPYIYTNVESGYSARSFPQVFVQRYKYGPQGDKFQTTPQVAPVYSPR